MDRRLIQLGVSLFLISLFVGLAVPYFAVPRLGLSVHLLGLMQGTFLAIVGILWPRLKLTRTTSRAVFWFLAYGCIAAWASNLVGAVSGAGNSIVPIAAGSAHGSELQEMVIVIGLRSGGLSLIVGTALVLWGLRGADPKLK